MTSGPDPTRPPAENSPWSSPPAYPQPPSEQPSYRQTAYGQPSYVQSPATQNPYPQSACGQAPGPYGVAPYGSPYAGSGPSNGLGLTAMIVGIVSIPFGLACGIGIIGGILAIVFGFIGRGRANRGEATNGGQALAGIICGAAALVLTVIGYAVYFLVILGNAYNHGTTML